MRKIIIAAVLACSFSYAASLDWFNSYEPAKLAAEKSHKRILLLVVSPTCPYCVKLLNGPMSDLDVIQNVQQSYEPLMLMNMEQLPDDINAKGVPAMYKLSSNGKKIGAPLIGLQDTQTIKQWLAK